MRTWRSKLPVLKWHAEKALLCMWRRRCCARGEGAVGQAEMALLRRHCWARGEGAVEKALLGDAKEWRGLVYAGAPAPGGVGMGA